MFSRPAPMLASRGSSAGWVSSIAGWGRLWKHVDVSLHGPSVRQRVHALEGLSVWRAEQAQRTQAAKVPAGPATRCRCLRRP